MIELNILIYVLDGLVSPVIGINEIKNLTTEKIKCCFCSTYAQTKSETYCLTVVCTEKTVGKIMCKFVEFIKKQVNENGCLINASKERLF